MNRREMFKVLGGGAALAAVAPGMLKAKPAVAGPPNKMAALVTAGGHVHHEGDMYLSGNLFCFVDGRWVKT